MYCRKCRYPLSQIAGDGVGRCPECGCTFDPKYERTYLASLPPGGSGVGAWIEGVAALGCGLFGLFWHWRSAEWSVLNEWAPLLFLPIIVSLALGMGLSISAIRRDQGWAQYLGVAALGLNTLLIFDFVALLWPLAMAEIQWYLQ